VYYVYLIESLGAQGERYVGMTTDLKQRLGEHNAGKSSHTSKFRPWKLCTHIACTHRAKAEAFERYLKSGSGHAFAGQAPLVVIQRTSCFGHALRRIADCYSNFRQNRQLAASSLYDRLNPINPAVASNP
jgi:predicted GIY-YIG superfamily endonuclease